MTFCPLANRDFLLDKDWSSIKLLTQAELDNVTASFLLVHTDRGLDISSKLSPLEVYSVDKLKDFRTSVMQESAVHQGISQANTLVMLHYKLDLKAMNIWIGIPNYFMLLDKEASTSKNTTTYCRLIVDLPIFANPY